MRRRGLWWAVAAGAVAVAAVVSLGIAYASSGPHHVFRSPVAGGSTAATATSSPSADPSPTRSTSASPTLLACLAPVPDEARCIKSPECYDAAKKPIDCAGRHTWEAFLAGDLPSDVKSADAEKSPRMQRVCSRLTLISIDPATIQDGDKWTVAVFVPASANRTYRCIASLGPNALSGPRLHVGTH